MHVSMRNCKIKHEPWLCWKHGHGLTICIGCHNNDRCWSSCLWIRQSAFHAPTCCTHLCLQHGGYERGHQSTWNSKMLQSPSNGRMYTVSPCICTLLLLLLHNSKSLQTSFTRCCVASHSSLTRLNTSLHSASAQASSPDRVEQLNCVQTSCSQPVAS